MTATKPVPVDDTTGEIITADQVLPPWYSFLPWGEGVNAYFGHAENVAELLSEPPDAEGLIEHLGEPLTVRGAELHRGEIDGRTTVFLAIDAVVTATGRPIVLTTGAAAVLRQCARAYELGLYPFEATAYQADLGQKGKTDPIRLGVPGRAAKASDEPF